jgi:hypothetical protein
LFIVIHLNIHWCIQEGSTITKTTILVQVNHNKLQIDQFDGSERVMPNVTLYVVLIEGLILTLWERRHYEKMDSILNILVHWKMLFWVRLAITSIWSI